MSYVRRGERRGCAPSQGARVEIETHESYEVPEPRGKDGDELPTDLGRLSLSGAPARAPSRRMSARSPRERSAGGGARGPSAPVREERAAVADAAASAVPSYTVSAEDHKTMVAGAAYIGETYFKGSWNNPRSPGHARWTKAVQLWVGMYMTNTEKVAPQSIADRAAKLEEAQHRAGLRA